MTTDPFLVAVLIGITRLLFTIIAAWMSRRFGRRPTALISGAGMTLSLMVLATHLLLQHQKQSNQLESLNRIANETQNISTAFENSMKGFNKPPSFLPIISILIYIISSTIGFLTLPWSMIGEVFPVQIRGVRTIYVLSFNLY